MHKDLRKLVKALEEQGFDVEPSSKGHQIVRKDGRRVATIAGTASDSRARMNAVADLRRAGFVWNR